MKKEFKEGITKQGTPDLKYYAFDWDDNIVHMPTKIILEDENGEEVPMTTEDFALYREKIGKENFDYDGQTIVGYAENPFRNFRVEGDDDFLVDAMRAKTGPAWPDFVEAVNNGSIFAIITARGHHPDTLKEGVYNYIINNFKGINKNKLIKNLKKYRDFAGEEEMTDDQLIRSYLELNRYNPVSFGDTTGVSNPEEAKVRAMENFIYYVKSMASLLKGKAVLKKDIANKFIPAEPQIGFSDDDLKNLEAMKTHFKDKENVQTYSTAGGIKKKY